MKKPYWTQAELSMSLAVAAANPGVGQFRDVPDCIFNSIVLTAEAVTCIVRESGVSTDLGEWRNERKNLGEAA